MSLDHNKFARVHDAASYINNELHRRNFLQPQQKLLFQSVDDASLKPQLASINNDKLLINTLHKLLRALDVAESGQSSRSSSPDTPSPAKPPRKQLSSHSPADSPRTTTSRISKPQRQDLASFRRQEVVLEQLRSRLHRHANDVTWKTVPIGEVSREDDPENTSGSTHAIDHTSAMLQSLLENGNRMSCALNHLCAFLQTANAFFYTRCAHDCECEVPKPVDLSQPTPQHQEPSEAIARLQELVNDWHDIGKLL